MEINGKGEGKEGVFCRCKGDYKREEKKKEEEIKGKIPRSQKGESMWGLFRGQGRVYRNGTQKKNIIVSRPEKVNRFYYQFLGLG